MISFTSAWSRTPCGFQTMSDNSLRNRTWAGSFKLPHWLSCLGFALEETVLFRQHGRRLTHFTSAVLLFHHHDAGRLPGAFTGRKDGRRFGLRPVEAHDQIDQVVRRREPVALLVFAGRLVLNVEGQRTVSIFLQVRFHRRINKIAVDWVLDQQLAVAVVHRDRPEGVDRRVLLCRKGERVVVLAAIERFAIRERLGQRIRGFYRVVAVDTSLGAGSPLQPVSIVEGAVAEPRADLPAIDVFHSAGEELLHFGFAFLHSLHDSLLLFRRERLEVELLSRADAKASELFPNVLLFRTGRSELQ